MRLGLSSLTRPSSRRAPRPWRRSSRGSRVARPADGLPRVGDELTEKQRVLAARRGLHPGRDVDAARAQVRHGLGHVVGAQAARDDEAMVVGHALGQPPVEHLARTRVRPVDEKEVRAEVLEARNGGITGREGLDDGADPGPYPLRLLGGLVPVQLRRTQTGQADGLDDTLRRLVTEHAHRQHVLGQTLGDVPGQLDRDLAGRRGEHEADRRRAEADREQRVGLRRDAADLDEQVVAHRVPTV